MSLVRKLLFPISILYYIFQFSRNKLFDINFFDITEFKIPTICVGNLSLGGSGKTPLVNYIINNYKSELKIAFLSRGYNRNSSGYLHVDETKNVEEVGDEPFLIKKNHKNLIVSVSEDRVKGINHTIKKFKGIQLFVLDDAFQHRKLKCSLNIVLSKFDEPFYSDCIFPVGNLREPKAGIKRANIIIITKCPYNLDTYKKNSILKKINPSINQKVFFSTIIYDIFLIGKIKIKINELFNKSIILVTGIADSSSLKNYLLSKNIFFRHIKFNDHHKYSKSDINHIKSISSKMVVLTTKKDYYKIRSIEKLDNLYYQDINIKFLENEEVFNSEIKKILK